MEETFTVYVNHCAVKVYRGMQVKHALISCDERLLSKALSGDLDVLDENGFPVGLEGALHPGAKIQTRKKQERF